MRTIEGKAVVTEDGKLTVQVPADIEPGEHSVVVVIGEQANSKLRKSFEIPLIHVDAWPEDLSLSREHMYDEWGR